MPFINSYASPQNDCRCQELMMVSLQQLHMSVLLFCFASLVFELERLPLRKPKPVDEVQSIHRRRVRLGFLLTYYLYLIGLKGEERTWSDSFGREQHPVQYRCKGGLVLLCLSSWVWCTRQKLDQHVTRRYIECNEQSSLAVVTLNIQRLQGTVVCINLASIIILSLLFHLLVLLSKLVLALIH